MVYCGLTGDALMNPYVMAGYAEENGYYVAGAGTSWDFMSTGAEKLGLKVHSIGNSKEKSAKTWDIEVLTSQMAAAWAYANKD